MYQMIYKKTELYFCLYLTENEHYIVEDMLRKKCVELEGLEVCYYRQLKDGHIPMYREVKIVGNQEKINRLKSYMVEEYIDKNMERNPYKK